MDRRYFDIGNDDDGGGVGGVDDSTTPHNAISISDSNRHTGGAANEPNIWHCDDSMQNDCRAKNFILSIKYSLASSSCGVNLTYSAKADNSSFN